MGSIAFVATVLYPGKVIQISCKGQWNSKKDVKKKEEEIIPITYLNWSPGEVWILFLK